MRRFELNVKVIESQNGKRPAVGCIAWLGLRSCVMIKPPLRVFLCEICLRSLKIRVRAEKGHTRAVRKVFHSEDIDRNPVTSKIVCENVPFTLVGDWRNSLLLLARVALLVAKVSAGGSKSGRCEFVISVHGRGLCV